MSISTRDDTDAVYQVASGGVHQAQHLMELVRQHRLAEEQLPENAATSSEERISESVERQVTFALPVLEQLVAQISDAQAEWQRHWERSAVRVAAAIAERVIRRELTRVPEIPLDLVSEALRLAAGATDISLRVNAADHERLGPQVERLAETLCQLGPASIVADPDVSPGGCRVLTKFGEVDLRIESQLRQIEQELLCE